MNPTTGTPKKNFWDNLADAFNQKTTEVVAELNPRFAKCKENFEGGSVVFATSATVASVAAVCFTLIAVAFGSVFSLLLAGASAFVAYNANQLSKNLAEVAKVQAKYFDIKGTLNQEELKKDLAINTHGINQIIDMVVKSINQELKKL